MALEKKSVAKGALILAAAGLFTRALGFVYRIYMSNAIGAEGMGLFQLISPVYSLCWSISCAGITTTVSKLVASENAKKEYGNMGRILKQALLLSCGMALVVSAALFFFSRQLAFVLLNDGRTELSLRLLALAVPFMAAGSCIRGYFFGLQEQAAPAVSQTLEQILRMIAVYFLAGALIPMGLEYACLTAVAGIALGEIGSFLYVFVSYKRFKSRHGLVKKPTLPSGASLAMIISMALPLSLNRAANSALSTLENLLIPQRLQMSGMTAKEAISLFGQVTGMATPLIFFPSALLVSLSIALVPAISEAAAVGDEARIKETVSKSLMFTSVVGSFASMIFMTLPDELGSVIYGQDIGLVLFLLGAMCPLWYLGITLSGLLNGLGKHMFIFRNNVAASLMNIGCIYFFVPKFGVAAFIAGWAASLALSTAASFREIRKVSKIRVSALKWFVKPAIAAAASGLCVEYIGKVCVNRFLPALPALLASLALMSLSYFALILALGCVKISDISGLYKSKKAAD